MVSLKQTLADRELLKNALLGSEIDALLSVLDVQGALAAGSPADGFVKRGVERQLNANQVSFLILDEMLFLAARRVHS